MSQIILPYDQQFFQEYGVYIKPVNYPLSGKKIDSLRKIAYMQKYFQCNPVKFIDIMFNIQLLDFQALLVERSWMTRNVLVVMSRGAGKSTVIDLQIMSKGMLFSNYWAYIASGSGSQAEDTFMTLERLANDSIENFQGSTGKVFKNQVVKNAANGDGFSHNPNGFIYTLYDGSFTQTLNANIDRRRGKRGSVIFDESGFLSEEMLNVYSAFAIVNKTLKTGKDASGNSIDAIRQRTFPTNVPNQRFFISSASDVSTPFYGFYREFAKKQIEGDPDFCVLHIDCQQCIKPTLRGEVVAPLLTRSQVDSEMRISPEKARREYYCLFTTDGGTNAIIKRGTITRNEQMRVPDLRNPDGKRKYILTYDPARLRDNSIITIGQLYEDGKNNYKVRIVNCVSLIDIGKKTKTPMQIPDQVQYLRQLILRYNGGDADDGYPNIVGVWIDAGSGGGGGTAIADLLLQDWTDATGVRHRGFIDREYSSEYVSRFPTAVDKIHFMQPSNYKSLMYEALIEMVNTDKIKFTSTYDNKGYLTIFDVDDKKMEAAKRKISAKYKKMGYDSEELQEKVFEELKTVESVNTKIIKLDWEEELALANIDAMKEQLVNIVRKKRESGRDGFELAPEKANKLHDDRAYTACMLGWALAQERRKQMMTKPKPKIDLVKSLPIRKATFI